MNITILVYILGALVIILFGIVIFLNYRLSHFFKGSNAKSLESTIRKIYEQNEALSVTQKEINSYLEKIDKRVARSIQDVKTIRFNPFADEGGGKQSFATAFLNEKGDGVVLSSLYSRDRMSIFAKPIKDFKSEFALSEEEKEVLKK